MLAHRKVGCWAPVHANEREKSVRSLWVYHRTCCARGPLTLLIIIIDQVYLMCVADTCVLVCRPSRYASVPTAYGSVHETNQ